MATMRQLEKLRFTALTTAKDEWGQVAARCGGYMDRVDREMRGPLQGTWEGADADAAQFRLGQLSQNFQYGNQQTALVRSTLDGLVEELRTQQKKLTEALDDAETRKYIVHDDGSVEYTGEGTENPHTGGDVAPDPNVRWAQEIADRIADAVNKANEIDGRYGQLLNRLQAPRGLTVDTGTWSDAAADGKAVRQDAAGHLGLDAIPKKGTNPNDVNSWWRGLSQEEQQEYIALHPASIGQLDGIPAEARDQANRARLREDQAETLNKLNLHLQSEPARKEPVGHGGMRETDEWKEWDKERQRLDGNLKGYDAIQANLDSEGRDNLPEAYLLGVSDEKNGRAIVARGNPDTADHTAVYVPGTTSNLSSIGGNMNRSDVLWTEAHKADPGSNVSVVTWLGYDAPQSVTGDARSSDPANDGGPLLNQFIDGTRATHTGDSPSHVTAVGHSYGSTVIGSAARQGDLNVDDIAVAGSPGMQVGRAHELDVESEHVWAMEGYDDPVPNLGAPYHAPREWRWWGEYDPVTPTADPFGANQVSADEVKGHSDYWDYKENGEPVDALRGQANIIVGRYDRVPLDD